MNIKSIISKSILKDGQPSSSRIFAYTMQLIIFLCGISAIGIELFNAIIQWKKGETHTIPWEHITLIGMWLEHKLTLLGIYKSNETKITKVGNEVNIKTSTKDEQGQKN